MERRSRFGSILRVVMLVLPITVSAYAAESRDATLEYAVKAAYLFKFGNYVEWPAAAFDTPQAPITLCVAGTDRIAAAGDDSLQNPHIGDRQIVVRHLASVSRDSGCRILFVGGNDARKIGQILDAVRGTNVLTVTEAEGAGQTGSVIRFVIDDNHVRFAIDIDAAAQNGISVSSKLLSLAMTVTPKR